MARARWSVPLYGYISALAVALVLATALVLRYFADLLPGAGELALLVAVAAVVAVVIARRIAGPLAQLAREADAVSALDFSDHPRVRSRVREIDALGAAFDLGRDTIRRFLRINRRLASDGDLEALRPWILDKLVDIAGARGGVLYLMDDAEDRFRVTALDMHGGRATAAGALPPLDTAALPRLLASARASGRPATGRLDGAELSALELDARWAEVDALAMPLHDRDGHWLGLLLLFRDGPFDPGAVSFVEAVAASAALSLEMHGLLRSQEALVDASIRMVATAIDAKSPYTGGHCERVPELALMLARAACDEADGPLAGFSLDGTGWKVLRTAAWLHDCGKVATPEHVVDKATKLETIHNRIHEIRTRFEVLKRDADIAYWQGRAEGGEDAALAAERDAAHAMLDEEFAFVARCNIGGEAMAGEDRDRLRAIAQRRWTRTLDDRLGLSWEERARLPEAPSPLPCEEPLLADRPEHRIARSDADQVLPGNRWGITMQPPELLYDHGELHNLAVQRGTLTPEERFRINQHMVHTVMMLEALPWPRHLRQVPAIACAHHEKLDGTGYPRGLSAADLGVEARILAIADVFEALTAADRPYKAGMPLSQALSIMARMRDADHIDGDLFAVFLRSGLYRDYAERFMSADQVDSVDIDTYA